MYWTAACSVLCSWQQQHSVQALTHVVTITLTISDSVVVAKDMAMVSLVVNVTVTT